MRTTLRRRLDAWQHPAQHTAPHVDADWAETLLVELRLRRVDGARIREVLAEVESHCAESGQSAPEAFGPAEDYAASLALPAAAGSDTRTVLAAAGGGLAQTVGMLGLLGAFDAWLTGGRLDITVGQLVLVAGLGATLAGVAWRIDAVLRATVRHPVRVWLITMVHLSLTVALLLLLDGVAFRLEAVGTLVAGLGLLVVGTVLQVRGLGPDVADPVVAPFGRASREGRDGGRATRLTALASAFVVPVLTLVLLAAAWWARG